MFGNSKFDSVLMDKTRNLLNELKITNIHNYQAYDNDNKKIIMLNYYFSQEWDSGIKLVFYVIDDKLKFQKFGKFGWRNEKYNTESNNEILKELILKIENFIF